PDRYVGHGEPWQPLKMYYFVTFHRARFLALHEGMLARGLESPYAERLDEWLDEEPGRPSYPITTRVRCGEYFELRDQALLAHGAQVDPGGFWFACPADVQREAWPTEDYHLARSVVGGPAAHAGAAGTAVMAGTAAASGPAGDTDIEDDLFAGIREKVPT